MSMKNFSSHFKLGINGHRDIEFVDIPVDTDVKLFIDPGLIESREDPFSRICSMGMMSYFEQVFECCREKDLKGLKKLFAYCGEINFTHLGNSQQRSCGRGASEDILMGIFSDMIRQGLFEHEIILSPSDVYVLAPNFDKDRMSDLLTNVMFQHLAVFTNRICRNIDVPLERTTKTGFWNADSKCWEMGHWPLPAIGGAPILLVPKHFVSRSYHYTTGNYISKYLLEYRKRFHLDTRSDMCYEREYKDGSRKLMPPTKAELRAKELTGQLQKEHAVDFALKNPETMGQFRRERKISFVEGIFELSDHDLDMILYTSKFKSA